MDYTQAVRQALAGNEEGFQFLYEETYKSKYYLALKYMKDEEAAKDVMQDAYIKAFTKLHTLENPETFASWLGVIVANTAKNALVKQNPVLFTDIGVDSEGESSEYEIEDDNMQNQPEIAYTRQETQELVHELLDTLPEEQKMCLLMFHIEDRSIREIAETLECSENTVKSRLNYGRKNLKAKAEELQKKGYKLYSVAPVTLLLYLLRMDAEAMSGETSVRLAGAKMAENIKNVMRGASGSTGTNVAATASAASATVKTGFFATVGGKIAVAAVALCLAGGGFAVATSSLFEKESVITEESDWQEDESEEIDQQETEEEEVIQEEVGSVDDSVWKQAYVEIIEDVPNQTYQWNEKTIKEPTAVYYLHDMDDDEIPELILSVYTNPMTSEDLDTVSSRMLWVGVYTYQKDTGTVLLGEDWYDMPAFAKENINESLIIYCQRDGAYRSNMDYYKISIEDGELLTEEMSTLEFTDWDEVNAFNEQFGIENLKSSKVDDDTDNLDLLLNY